MVGVGPYGSVVLVRVTVRAGRLLTHKRTCTCLNSKQIAQNVTQRRVGRRGGWREPWGVVHCSQRNHRASSFSVRAVLIHVAVLNGLLQGRMNEKHTKLSKWYRNEEEKTLDKRETPFHRVHKRWKQIGLWIQRKREREREEERA